MIRRHVSILRINRATSTPTKLSPESKMEDEDATLLLFKFRHEL